MNDSNQKQFNCFLIIFTLIFFFQSLAVASNELEQIKQAIAAKGAKWIAGENWVTKLTPEERKRLCGASLEPPDPAEAKLLALPVIDNLPAAFDWRDNNGNWVTPVRDQGQCGSCWDFSAVGQVEAWWKIHTNNLDSMLDLSEQFVLSCSEGSCNGWPVHRALDFIADVGVPLESCFRYQALDTIPCSNACSDWEQQAIKIPGWGYITLEEDIIDNIKSAIFRHPVSASFVVYEDFYSYAGGVYEYVWGEVDAGHAIVIVGWNDEEQSWICKNSWGPRWGEDGYFRIKWSNCGMGRNIPFIWSDMTGGPALAISPDRFNLNLTWGDSIVHEVTFTNLSPKLLEFSALSTAGGQIMFHPDRLMAWDDFSWWCGDPQLGGYDHHWLEYLDTPMLDLSNTTNPHLSWMGNWSIDDSAKGTIIYDGGDGCNVWISIDGGRTFEVATPISPPYNCRNLLSFSHPQKGWNLGRNIHGWSGSSGGWVPVEFDLSEFKTDSVIIRFAFASDVSIATADDSLLYGFLVDEILVSDTDTILFEDQGNDLYSMQRIAHNNIANVDWIDIFDRAGAIAPYDSTQVGLIINTRNLTSGNYHGLIDFTTNDTTRPSASVSFDMQLRAPEHDVSIEKALLPDKNLILFSSIELNAIIKNYGLNDETDFDVTCQVVNNRQAIYSDTVHVTVLKTGESMNIQFEPFYASQVGQNEFVITLVNLNNDYNAFNNSIQSTVTVANLIDDFETVSGFWSLQGGWGLTDQHDAYSGSFTAHVNNGVTPYENNMDAIMMLSQNFDFHGVDNATLKFWTRYNTERAKDICYLETSVDSVTWSRIDSLSGVKPAWTQYSIDFTDLIQAGYTQIWFRFHFISDNQTTRFGVFIDDVEIYSNPTSVYPEVIGAEIPQDWHLSQNFPNPFNLNTKISYRLPQAGNVNLVIYNIQGQIVRHLLNAFQTAGSYFIDWNGCDDLGNQVVSGVYFYHLTVEGKFTNTKKLILMK